MLVMGGRLAVRLLPRVVVIVTGVLVLRDGAGMVVAMAANVHTPSADGRREVATQCKGAKQSGVAEAKHARQREKE